MTDVQRDELANRLAQMSLEYDIDIYCLTYSEGQALHQLAGTTFPDGGATLNRLCETISKACLDNQTYITKGF